MKRQGFTFLEVVLALAIIGIISAFLLRFVSGSINITENVTQTKISELDTAGKIEAKILDRDTRDDVDDVVVTDEIDIITLFGADIPLNLVEQTDEVTGQLFRYYLPNE